MSLIIRGRLTYANVAATLALVFSMSGGALAATHYLISSTKQISPKVLKQLKGNAGPAGAAGRNGAPGASGPPGPLGEKGPVGANGGNGSNGVGVTEAGAASKSECESGGIKYASASGTNHVCNGVTGFTKTLPKGKTETGDFAVLTQAAEEHQPFATSASFNIPLAAAAKAHYIRTTGEEAFYNETTNKQEERVQPACPGNAAEPSATEGSLCVYAESEENVAPNLPVQEPQFVLPSICALATQEFSPCLASGREESHAADPYGFGVIVESKESGTVSDYGSWAVTAGEA